MRRTTGEERVFGACLVVLAVHAAGAAGSVWAAVGAVALAVAGVAAFLWRGRIVRTLLAAGLGLAATAVGIAVHAAHALLQGPAGSDYTGILMAIAGLVLLGLSFRLALRGRRFRVKLLAIPVCLVLVQWFVVPVMTAGVVTNVPRTDIAGAGPLGLPGARDVEFRTPDGVRLSGWYGPGRSRAAVVLMHGSHGDRSDTADHLRLLAKAGFGVLAFDARGHGDSAGQTNALGWRGEEDVAGAVAFLRRQNGVDPRRIGALGLSMGGEEALRAAAEGVPLAAVIADGAGASTTGDQRLASDAAIPQSVNWLAMRATELFAGEHEPAPLRDIVNRIRCPVLLIASNAPDELTVDRAFRDRIGPRATLWHVPDAGHTKALDEHPAVYADRVEALLRGAR